MRLLGKWISKGNDALFDKLNGQYSFLLTMMVSGLRTSEPALRCASLEACQGMIHVTQGIVWLLQNNDAKSLIALSLMDESIYVVTQGCKFYLFMMEQENTSEEYKQLCQHMDPSVQIKHFLEQQHHPSLLMAALEFCWTFSNSTCSSVFCYLARTHLLVTLPNLLQLNNRIIRKRVIEIFSTLFRHSSSPIQLLTSNYSDEEEAYGGGDHNEDNVDQIDQQQQHLRETYTFINATYTNMMTESPTSMDDVCTSIETLQASLELIARLKQDQPTALTMAFVTDSIQSSNDTLMELLNVCMVKRAKNEQLIKVAELIQESSRPIFLQRKLLQVVLQTFHLLVEKFSLQIKIADILEAGLQVLSSPSFANDQRLLKSCLQLVSKSLHCLSNRVSSMELQPTFFKFMMLLIDKMDDGCLSSQNLTLVLSTLDELLGHEPFESHFLGQNTLRPLMNAIRLKFVDVEWDVRDAMIEFVGGLFEPGAKGDATLKNKIDFAISLDLPLLVLDRIKDQEPYVRASALKTVQIMMKTGPGWNFIQQHEQLRSFSRTLPRLLYDTEAFVRRATLDAMSCLVEHRSCEGLLLTQPDQVAMDHKDTLSTDTLSMLMNDDDIEVRIRLCRLLDHMWQLKMQERDQSKRHTSILLTQDNQSLTLSYFYFLHGDHWLLELIKDSQRLVRLEAMQVIERILTTYETATTTTTTTGSKRSRLDDDEKDTAFMKQLGELDLVHIKRTTNPEDLYQEAFDINPTMMTQLTDPTDDAHLLDCY
ncbi:hypothetical protein BCR42DRAFT_425720 [Absidia repens]|uniref:Armadillo-type protein n=1 Tax=Absidia repens TaxID=90262 RepID=A0A1X2I2G6_9FUNG|nr:hypothetical protein BCR42DRAFT_425720 [Absidia repens]